MKNVFLLGSALVLGSTPAFAQIDMSGGFGTGTGFQANGNATFTGGRARLTPAANNQTGSVFFTTQQDVRSFVTMFTFQFTPGSNPMADGICFVLQRAGATALGTGGGNLGYQGIATSVAVKFDIWPSAGSYTGMYSNGAAPGTPETAINPTVNFHNGNIFRADILYDGTTLDVTITDTVSSASVNQTYTVDTRPSWAGPPPSRASPPPREAPRRSRRSSPGPTRAPRLRPAPSAPATTNRDR